MLTFPSSTDASVVSWFQERLCKKVPQISVQLCRHAQMGQIALYCSPAAEHLLLRGAEELRMRKRLRPEWGGGHREFSCAEQDCFEGAGQLSGQERQRVMLHWLREGLRATGPGDHPGPSSGHHTPCLEGQCLGNKGLYLPPATGWVRLPGSVFPNALLAAQDRKSVV